MGSRKRARRRRAGPLLHRSRQRTVHAAPRLDQARDSEGVQCSANREYTRAPQYQQNPICSSIHHLGVPHPRSTDVSPHALHLSSAAPPPCLPLPFNTYPPHELVLAREWHPLLRGSTETGEEAPSVRSEGVVAERGQPQPNGRRGTGEFRRHRVSLERFAIPREVYLGTATHNRSRAPNPLTHLNHSHLESVPGRARGRSVVVALPLGPLFVDLQAAPFSSCILLDRPRKITFTQRVAQALTDGALRFFNTF